MALITHLGSEFPHRNWTSLTAKFNTSIGSSVRNIIFIYKYSYTKLIIKVINYFRAVSLHLLFCFTLKNNAKESKSSVGAVVINLKNLNMYRSGSLMYKLHIQLEGNKASARVAVMHFRMLIIL